MASAFYWLMVTLIISAIFQISNQPSNITPLAIYGPILQELGRIGFYYLLIKFKPTLDLIAAKYDIGITAKIAAVHHDFASGFGFGAMSTLIQSIQLLAQSSGPGIVPCRSCMYIDIYFLGILISTIFLFLNTFWSVTCYYGLYRKNYPLVVWVSLSHLGASLSTLLVGNENIPGGCWITISILVVLLFAETGICITIVRKIKRD